ncbi:MAG: hypothetical protein HY334_00815 [Armatimonadetes bacterium]|nr:hypothetical protein [Armatimonadota bacterium]
MVVLALIGVLLTIGVPNLYGYRARSALRAAQRQLIVDLRATQQRALSQDKDHAIEFAAGASGHGGYAVRQGGTVLWQTMFARDVHAVSALDGISFSAVQKSFTFAPNGAVGGAATAPAVCLDDRRGQKVLITVTPATGSVRLTASAGTC